MKCVCGYEHEEEFVNENGGYFYKTITGDEKFVEIVGHFTVTNEYDYAPSETRKVSLHACPKCGTVKLKA